MELPRIAYSVAELYESYAAEGLRPGYIESLIRRRRIAYVQISAGRHIVLNGDHLAVLGGKPEPDEDGRIELYSAPLPYELTLVQLAELLRCSERTLRHRSLRRSVLLPDDRGRVLSSELVEWLLIARVPPRWEGS